MKLTQVEVENFRCFERITVPLEPDVTAIIGVNGAGKTALLEALAEALQPIVASMTSKSQLASGSKETGYPSLTGSSVRAADVRAKRGRGGASNRNSFKITTVALIEEPNGPRPHHRLRWISSFAKVNTSKVTKYELDVREPSDLSGLGTSLSEPHRPNIAGNPLGVPAIGFYRDTRNCPSNSNPLLGHAEHNEEAAFINALNANADLDIAQRWFYTRENQELRSARERLDITFQFRDLAAIRDALSLMLDGLGQVYADDDPPRMKVLVAGPDGESLDLEFRQLSAGQRNLLALTVDFARRLVLAHPEAQAPLNAPGILLIDEIELNLHPKWQQTVIPHLRKVFPNTQIIVATHSPIVLSTLEARQIRILRDQKLYTPDVQTFGNEAGRIQRIVMGTETRPPDNPVAQAIEQIYARINDEAFDQAQRLLTELEAKVDSDDPALIEARTLIETRRWEKEIGL
jgi:predicted ATP-binding protein involved in virulence